MEDAQKVLSLWKKISKCIADEISVNEAFAQKIGDILFENKTEAPPKKSKRRAPGKIDPFALFEQGEDKLADVLQTLDIEELKDVIAENGMDPARLAMKWRKRERIEKHIMDMTRQRASKGDAFVKDSGRGLGGE